MKKAIVCLSFCVVAVLSMVGCSNLSVNGVDNQQIQTSGNSTVHFSIDFNDAESLAKSATIGDGLTTTERKALLNYRKARINELKIQLIKVENENGFKSDYTITLPIKDGVCTGYAKVDSGEYFIQCYDNGRILAGVDSIYTGDFNGSTTANIGESDTTNIDLVLEKRYYFPAILYIVTKEGEKLNGILDSVYNQMVIGGGATRPTIKSGYVEVLEVFSTKKDFTFFIGEKKYTGLFDVTKIIDNNVIEIVVTEVPQATIKSSISFADDAKMVIDSVFPADGATNVPTDIQNIVSYLNKNLADLSDMPGAQFGIASEDGSHQISGTYGLSANIFSRQLTTTSERVYLKPNTKYIAHVSLVKDEYGNEMVGEKRWSFTTGN
jgi:hypothetical protein